jgi:hypothetical protein
VPDSVKNIHIITWAPGGAEELARGMRQAGFIVSISAYDLSVQNELRQNPPAAVLIDLSRRPALGRDAAVQLRISKSTRGCALIFVGGQPEKVEEVRRLLPDAIYTSWEDALSGMKIALEQPIQAPIIPDGVFAAYEGRPLVRKLGIHIHSRLGVFHAPQGLKGLIGPLPAGVEWWDDPSETCDQALWFVRSLDELDSEIERVKSIAGQGGVWIFWQKRGSGAAGGPNQAQVRAAGLAHGLVDFKIAALDETWSGLRFAKREP